MGEIEQTDRRWATMGSLAKIFDSTGTGFNRGVFEGACPSCQEGCSVPREEHHALLVLQDETTLAGWLECPGCTECHATWGSTVPPQRCSWGRNIGDDQHRISNEKCLNESRGMLFVTDDDQPDIKTTLHLCVGHLAWMDEHLQLQRVDPARLN